MIQLRALACLAMLCLGAPRSAGPGAMPRVEAYVWQRVWTPEVLTTLQSDSAFITRWHILIAQGSSGAPFRRFTPDWAAVGRSGRPATPVIRIDGQLDGATSPALARDIATLFLAIPAPFRDRIEIDHDCATARLPTYAQFLTMLRASLPPRTAIDITALPTWLPAPALPNLIGAADHIILQVHGIDDPRTDLFQAGRAEGWVAALGRVSPRPFLVSVPAYGARIVRSAGGDLLGASGEAINPDPREGTEIVVSPASVAQFLHGLRAANSDALAGVVWFRLPLPSDLRSWSSITLRHVARGEWPAPRLVVTRTPLRGDTTEEVGLTNEGDDVALPERVAMSDGCNGDGTGNYGSDGVNFVRQRNSLLRYGQHLSIGWQRCSPRVKPPEPSVK